MLISHSKKFITVDIPKTGTRSLRESLCPWGIIDVVGKADPSAEFHQHGTVERAKLAFENNNWDWDEYYSFSIVRNPWERYFSFFKYFKNYAEKYQNKDSSIVWRKAEINQGKMCHEMFKNKNEKKILKNIINKKKVQSEYYEINGQVAISHIALFEDISNEFKKLCLKIDVDEIELKHGNKSSSSHNMHDIYNQELIDLVAEKEKSCIKLFNYDYS
jgi:hypothetical protein